MKDDNMNETQTYRIVRYFKDDRPKEYGDTNLTLEEAQAHCNDPATRGEDWFDGYEREDS